MAYRIVLATLDLAEIDVFFVCNPKYGSLFVELVRTAQDNQTPIEIAIFDESEKKYWLGHYKGLPLMLDHAFATAQGILDFSSLAWHGLLVPDFRREKLATIELTIA